MTVSLVVRSKGFLVYQGGRVKCPSFDSVSTPTRDGSGKLLSYARKERTYSDTVSKDKCHK